MHAVQKWGLIPVRTSTTCTFPGLWLIGIHHDWDLRLKVQIVEAQLYGPMTNIQDLKHDFMVVSAAAGNILSRVDE